jgi:pSer/pThr/pTyr-binding forkhead associated (FHA) protein
VRDLGSTNGIWINGRRVISGRLRPGDVLAIAHIRYRLEEGQGDRPCRAELSSRSEERNIASTDPRGISREERIETDYPGQEEAPLGRASA